MRMVRKKPHNGGPESGTKTDVVSHGALVKIALIGKLYVYQPYIRENGHKF